MKSIICHRCKKPIANLEDEHKFLAAALLIETGNEEEVKVAQKIQDEYLEKFCTCPLQQTSEFTSRPQPDNLDSIERRMK